MDGSAPCPACGTPPPAPPAGHEGDEPTLVPARALDVLEGKWRLEHKLGEGGMGIVYLAHDLQLDRKVAVKLLSARLAGDSELVTRFEREARLTAGLEHPNIVPVYAVGRYHGRPFMVMKALEGRTLAVFLREKGKLEPVELLHLGRQIAAGLDFIHARGFIHRDIKAGNIFVGPEGHATILDFGILRPSRGADALTRTGMVMGTPQYMSPEQAKGVRELDHRSDIYALAVLMFECVCGSLPFESHSDLAVVQMQAHTPAPDIRERAPWVSAEVAGVLARSLSKNPEERYPTAGDLIRALEAAYGGQVPIPLGAPMRATPSNPALPALSAPPAPAPLAAPPAPEAAPSPGVPEAAAPVRPRPSAPVVPSPSTAELARGLKPGRGRLIAVLAAPVLLLGGGALYLLRGGEAPVPARPEQGDPGARPAAPAQPQGQAPVEAPAQGQAPAEASAQPESAPPAPAQASGHSPPTPTAAPAPEAAASSPAEVDESTDEPVPLGPAGTEAAAPTRKPASHRGGPSVEPAVHKSTARGAGHLNVITTRRGESYWAAVLVDGVRKGTTPLLLDLAPGAHRVRVERIGFKPVERQITVAPGGRTVLRIPLVP